jgi:hypothetical protein
LGSVFGDRDSLKVVVSDFLKTITFVKTGAFPPRKVVWFSLSITMKGGAIRFVSWRQRCTDLLVCRFSFLHFEEPTMKYFALVVAAVAVTPFFDNNQANAEDLFAATTGNNVVVVDSNAPTVVTRSGAITGLAATESIFGLDYRANGGGVFAIGSLGNVYTIDQNSFAATPVGTALSPALVGSSFAYDFNPAAAGGILSRIISDTDNNRVIDSTTGGYFGTADRTAAFYAAGDANEGANPNIQGIAYDTNVAGATSTQQFGIDADLGVLTTVANNAGTLETIGSLGAAGVGLTNELGFDISGASGDAFASLQTLGGVSQLFNIDLATGGASLVGVFGGGETIRDFTVVPSAIPEPSSVVLLGLVAPALLGRRRKAA